MDNDVDGYKKLHGCHQFIREMPYLEFITSFEAVDCFEGYYMHILHPDVQSVRQDLRHFAR